MIQLLQQYPELIYLLGAAAGAIFLLLALAFGGGDGNTASRLARVAPNQFATADGHKNKNQPSLRRDNKVSNIKAFDAALRRLLPRPEKMRARLERTGRAITLSEYLLLQAVLLALFCSIFYLLLKMPLLLSLSLGLFLGLGVPHIVVNSMGDRRVAAFLEDFPNAIDMMCRGLKSGLPISESMNNVGREMADPIGLEFRRVSDAVRIGQSMDSALWDVAKRIDAPELKFLIIAMAIQRETGGNLGETLGNLAELLRRRKQLKLKIKAMSSEARASALIIGSLPFLMFAIIFTSNRDYAMMLINDPRGVVMLGIGLGMVAMGAAVMGKLIRFDI